MIRLVVRVPLLLFLFFFDHWASFCLFDDISPTRVFLHLFRFMTFMGEGGKIKGGGREFLKDYFLNEADTTQPTIKIVKRDINHLQSTNGRVGDMLLL